MGGQGVASWEEVLQKCTEMENVLLGLDLREYVPAFMEHKVGLEEILLMKEENNVKVGVKNVNRLLMG